MENKKFDDFIKQSLEHLDGENYIPMDWSSMNEHLEADGLDEAMKGSLENLEGAAFIPMDWSLMESKLDADLADANADAEIDPQMEDIYLDAVAYDHLNNLQTPYKPEHWEIMSARLDEEYAYRRKLFITKAFEAAIILLLVWTAFNYFPNKKPNTPQNDIANTNSIQNDTKDHSTNLPTQLSSSDKSKNGTIATDNISEIKTNPLAQNSDELKSANQFESSSTSESSNIAETNSLNSIPTLPNYNSNPKIDESPFLSTINSISLLENENRNTSNDPFDKTLALNDEPLLNKKLQVQIAAIPSLATSLVEPEESNKYDYATLFRKKKLHTHEIFFSMYSSADMNIVESDFFNSDIRAIDVYQRSRYGYGGGFSLGFQLNRLLIETGAAYHFVSYNQRTEANIIGTVASGGFALEKWEDAELNMINIPLNIQYSFLVKNKWRMYSLTGASLNMALQNNYNFQLEETHTASRSISAEESDIANEALLYKGILEGGGLKENSYLTANIGIGLERKFTYRWSLFLQPIYRRHFLIDGIGPQKDKIHSGSVRFGAKVKIR